MTFADARAALAVYLRPRLILILVLGFASGLPLLLTASTLTIRLREAGVELTAIGLFSLVGVPYSLKFLWAPMLDRLPLPGLTTRFGRRRGWMLGIHGALIVAIAGLGAIDPATGGAWFNAALAALAEFLSAALDIEFFVSGAYGPAASGVWFIAALAVLVAFLSATQDIAIDAYRIEVLTEDEYGAGAAMAVYGFRGGMLMATVGTLYLAEWIDWQAAYAITALTLLVGVVAILVAPEPETAAPTTAPKSIGELFGDAYWAPLAEFVQRKGWVLLLLFVLFYKFGDALLSQMTGALYVDLGFEKSTIAEVGKLYGFFAVMAGTFLGGVAVAGFGLGRTLLVGGVLQAISNLGYWRLAEAGNDVVTLAWVVGFENFATGLGQTAFVAFLMQLCDKRYTAAQFALLTSIFAFSPKVLVAPAGVLAEAVGWSTFTLATAVAALPGLLLLIWLLAAYPDTWRATSKPDAS